MRVRQIRLMLLLAGFLIAGLPGLASSARADDTIPEDALRARDAMRGGDTTTALEASQRAVEGWPSSLPAWRVRGWVLRRTGDTNGAVEAYRTALRLRPGDAIANNNLGIVLLGLGDLEEALQRFDAAVAAAPTYADAINNRGVVLERRGDDPEARRAYRAAAEADPEHAAAHNNLGAALLKSGDREGALAAFERASRLDAAFDAPALNLALLQDPELADAANYQRLLEAAARPGASVAIRVRALAAQAMRASGRKDWSSARRLYLEAVELQPRNARILNNLGAVEDQLHMDRFAALHLNEALAIDPNLHVARNNLGIVQVHRGEPRVAERTFREIIRRDPRFHRAHYNLAVLLASTGRVGEARASLERAAALAPGDAAVRYNLGLVARARDGGAAAEREAYEAALVLEEELAEAHLSLGCLLADPETPSGVRDPVRARRHLERFLELALPSDGEGKAQARAWLDYLDQQ